MIEVQNLYKYYGDDDVIKAVDGVNFCCQDGQITGLLGPNGAGKTTTLHSPGFGSERHFDDYQYPHESL